MNDGQILVVKCKAENREILNRKSNVEWYGRGLYGNCTANSTTVLESQMKGD